MRPATRVNSWYNKVPINFDRLRTPLFWILAVAMVGWRFVHFGPQIDSPHQWRQCDTANYIHDFHEDGIDLLYPTVCWMGGYKTVILEFPLHEAVAATFYNVFGADHRWARLTTLLFFLVAVVYLHRFVVLISHQRLAQWVTLVYLALPLGIFYSRAIHIDFTAVAMAHGMAFHYARGFKHRRWKDFAIGALFAGLALMNKAPYAFFLFLPLLHLASRYHSLKLLLRQAHWFILPLVGFVLWQMHVRAVNAAAPDWYFIPHYSKFVDKWGWYFGIWEMRELTWVWRVIAGRVLYEVAAGWYGLVPFAASLLTLGWRNPAASTFRWWLLGTGLYVFIFFNLNFVHNYYQIPLMVPVAFFLGYLLYELEGRLDRWKWGWGMVMGMVLWGALAGNGIRLTEGIGLNGPEMQHFGDYYRTNPFMVAAGDVIQKQTERQDLVIVSYGGLDCRAPHLLYRSRRHGWSIEDYALTPSLLDQLRAEGATHLAWFFIHEPSIFLKDYLRPFPFSEHHFSEGDPPLFIYSFTSPSSKKLN